MADHDPTPDAAASPTAPPPPPASDAELAAAEPGVRRFTLRQKVFKIFGNEFRIFDDAGRTIAYCKQKFLRLREDMPIYTDETKTTEFLRLSARSIIDFGATYDVLLPSGDSIGSLRRRGFKSMLRDSWHVFDNAGADIGAIVEDSAGLAAARRFVPLFATVCPQTFHIEDADGGTVAVLKNRFNPFIYKLDGEILKPNSRIDELMVIAAACLIAAIEGRQSSGSSGSGLFSGN
jgi:uncharacterized protein YxjI